MIFGPRRYPLSVDDQRDFAADFTGVVHVWDVDKTYLATHFSSLEGLSRIPMEFAIDKQAIPGMPELLRGLRRGVGEGFQCVPLYFVSASPPQLRRVIERKMLLDGVEHDGIIFKDWLATLRQLRPGRLREQLGFKIVALLTGRHRRPHSREYLVGDDTERDAEAFSLYAQVIAGEVEPGDLDVILRREGVEQDDRRFIDELVTSLPRPLGSVERIFIHQAHSTPREELERRGRLVVPVANALELAIAAYGLGLVTAEIVRGTHEVCSRADPRIDIDEVIEESVERGLVSQSRAADLIW
jgi:hypothetical protein